MRGGMAGPTVTAKVTAKATDNLTKNPGTPNVGVGVKCEVKPILNGLPFEVHIGGKTYNLDSPPALSGATVTAGVSTDNPTGPNEGVSAGVTQVGGHTFYTGQFDIRF